MALHVIQNSMKKLLYLPLAALVLATAATGCSKNEENSESDLYKDLTKRYHNADSKKNKQIIEEEARASLTASEFEKFEKSAHPERFRDPKHAYNPVEDEAVKSYVAEYNRLVGLYRAAPAGSAERQEIYKQLVDLENVMHNTRSREAYEAFLLLRDNI